MAINVINGTDIVVKIKRSGDTDPVAIYCSTSGTLNINVNTVAASCKDSGSWESNVDGTKSWTVDVDGLYQVDTEIGFVDLADLVVGAGPNDVEIVFGQDTVTGDIYWTGSAVLTSASLTAPDGEIATWSASFVGDGALTKTTK